MTKLDVLLNNGFDSEIIKLHSNNHKRREYMNHILDVELLTELFNRYTAHAASIEVFGFLGLKLSAGSIIERATKLGIKTPTTQEQARKTAVRNKYKDTCLLKYGTLNALSKGTTAYTKKNNTIIAKYGVSNVFQLESIKEKAKKTMLGRYGVTHNIYRKDRYINTGRKSKPHTIVENILTELNVSFSSEKNMGWLAFNNELKKEYCPRPDIVLADCKIVIEIYGDRWHANPEMYKASDYIQTWAGNESAEDIWKFDQIRVRHIESFGYKVHVFWEKDILKQRTKVKEQLNEICKN
jgi:hypothetical protein